MRFALLCLSLLTTGDKPMGLDSYAYAAKTVKPHPEDNVAVVLGYIDPTSDEYVYFDEEPPIEFAYWRKFNALHAWMENLYHSKGGKQEFNCIKLPLTLEDLEALKSVCKNKELTPKEGFFFGSQAPVDNEAYDNVLQFIKEAKQHINNGYTVCYDSWW